MFQSDRKGDDAMAIRQPKPPSPKDNGLLPDENSDIEQEIASILAEPQKWLDMPNDQLGGEKPKQLIGTHREPLLRDLLRSIKHGMPT
jgi:hypothetical protein